MVYNLAIVQRPWCSRPRLYYYSVGMRKDLKLIFALILNQRGMLVGVVSMGYHATTSVPCCLLWVPPSDCKIIYTCRLRIKECEPHQVICKVAVLSDHQRWTKPQSLMIRYQMRGMARVHSTFHFIVAWKKTIYGPYILDVLACKPHHHHPAFITTQLSFICSARTP